MHFSYDAYSRISAKVHTETASGISDNLRRCAVVPPIPDNMVTHWRPFLVKVIGWALTPEGSPYTAQKRKVALIPASQLRPGVLS